MKQKLIEPKEEIDKYTIIIEDFITTLWIIDRTKKQKVIKDVLDLNSTTSELDLIDIYTALHLATAENRFFSSAHETCPKYVFGPHWDHKAVLNKFKRVQVTENRLFDPNGIKVDIRGNG